MRLYGYLVKVHGREISFCIYAGKGDAIRRRERKKTSPSETRLASLFLQCYSVSSSRDMLLSLNTCVKHQGGR